MTKPLEDQLCSHCGLCCDDLQVTMTDGSPEFHGACPQGEQALRQSWQWNAQQSKQDLTRKLETAKAWLSEAHQPLVTGLQGMSLEESASTIQFAERMNMLLSTGSSSEETFAEQKFGGFGCSFGEIRHRCDLLVCINIDLFSVWPRLAERFWNTSGRFLNEESQRKCWFVGDTDRLTDSSPYQEMISIAEPELLPSLIHAHRQLLTARAESPLDQLLQADISNAQYPVLVSGPGTWGLATQIASLVMEINETSRLHHLSVHPKESTAAFNETLLARTGFPDHVRWHEAGIEYDPQRFTTDKLLKKQEVDLLIILGNHVSTLVESALLQNVPRIMVLHHDPDFAEFEHPQLLNLPIAACGFATPGTYLRADGVPVPIRQNQQPQRSPDLTQILAMLSPESD